MPEKLLHKIPDSVSLEAAALAEPCAIVAHQMLERGRIIPGETVVIMGMGPIAIIAAQMARIAGAGKIVMCGCTSDEAIRLDIVKKLNCCDLFINVQKEKTKEVLSDILENGGVDVVVEASGADEMFPTIDPCVVNGNSYPCHGEVSRVSHRYYVDENKPVIKYYSNELKYDYKKIISENTDGSLNIKYEIKNNSDADFPCIWAFHMMFSSVDGGYAFASLPDDAHGEIMFDDTKRFGKREDIIALNKEHFTNGKYQKDGDAYKYYITKPLKNGVCGYWRNDVKSCLKLTYDVKKLPYLGIWVNDGGFKEMHSMAVEPCNIPYDCIENAKKHGCEFSIPSKAVFEFEINLSLDNIQ